MPKNDMSLTEEAFDILADELGEQLSAVRGMVARAAQDADYDGAGEALRRAKALDALIEELADLRRRALALVTQEVSDARPRLQRGLKTPQEVYHRPILQALVDLGGNAAIGDVLDRVYEQMKGQLNEHDLSCLASGDTPRWRNTAQWARNTMREEGLIVAGSPHGVWEISEQGRAWLAE